MNTRSTPHRRMLALAALALACGGVASPSWAAPVPVTFSGGQGTGTAISVQIAEQITYVVTRDTPYSNLGFVFRNTGPLAPGIMPLAGSFTYTVNGGAPRIVNEAITFNTNLDVTANDLWFYLNGSTLNVSLGDVIVLSPATVMLNGTSNYTAPPTTSYETFIADGFGNNLGLGYVPEPASLAMIVAGSATLLRRSRPR